MNSEILYSGIIFVVFFGLLILFRRLGKVMLDVRSSSRKGRNTSVREPFAKRTEESGTVAGSPVTSAASSRLRFPDGHALRTRRLPPTLFMYSIYICIYINPRTHPPDGPRVDEGGPKGWLRSEVNWAVLLLLPARCWRTGRVSWPLSLSRALTLIPPGRSSTLTDFPHSLLYLPFPSAYDDDAGAGVPSDLRPYRYNVT